MIQRKKNIKLHHAERGGKKTTRKLTILRITVIILGGKKGQTHTHLEEKNKYTEGFSFKKYIF